jgi:hypothetical protein
VKENQGEKSEKADSNTGGTNEDRRLSETQSNSGEDINQPFHLDVEQSVQGTSPSLGLHTEKADVRFKEGHVDGPLDVSSANHTGSQESEILIGEIKDGKQVVLWSPDSNGSVGLQNTLDSGCLGISLESEAHVDEAASQPPLAMDSVISMKIEKPKRGLKLEIRNKNTEIHEIGLALAPHC